MNKTISIFCLLLLIGLTSSAYVCLGNTNGCSACATDLKSCTGCKTGWFLDAVKTSATVGQCLLCDSVAAYVKGCAECDATKCSKPKTGFGFQSSDNTVFQCPEGCLSCSKVNPTDDPTCSNIDIGRFLLAPAVATGSKTYPKCIDNCSSCTDATAATCKAVFPGFYFEGAGLAQCTDVNCWQCADRRDTCTKCNNAFILQVATTTAPAVCLACPAKCAVCPLPVAPATTVSDCTTCMDGFFKKLVNSKFDSCVACSDAQCTNCSGDQAVCTACKTGYSAVSGACIQCSANCSACTVAGQCNVGACDSGYTREAVGFTCVNTCSANCGTDISACAEKGTKCITCNEFFGPVSATDAACSACDPNCKVCTTNYGGKCDTDQCKTGYAFDASSKTCKACSAIAGCTACTYSGTTTTCTACDESAFYFATPDGGAVCVSCRVQVTLADKTTKTKSGISGATSIAEPNATKCTFAASPVVVVTECAVGWFLKDEKCYQCSTAVYQFGTGKTLPGTNIADCSYALSITTSASTTCQKGYFLDTDKCTICPTTLTNCIECSSATVCTKCTVGASFFLTGTPAVCTGAVTGAVTNCAAYSDATTCSACKPGYFKTADTPPACSACIGTTSATAYSCTSCTAAGGTTYTAVCTPKDGLSVVSNAIVICTTGCKVCTTTSDCTTPKDGYWLDSTTLKACTADWNCATCDATKCLTCTSGYYLFSTSICVKID